MKPPPRCYGLPGIASEIHWRCGLPTRNHSYGLPGIASEIHWDWRESPVCGSYGLPGIASEIHSLRYRLRPGARYGLPGIASEIHWAFRCSVYEMCYGLPGIASEIHCPAVSQLFWCAMVCRESLLRYTEYRMSDANDPAMVCRESLLRYTWNSRCTRSPRLWFAGNRF